MPALNTPTLYHARTSVCSVKARLALAEKGVNFDSKLLTLRGDQFDLHYMKLNPNAVVPTLVHDGRVIIESTVIMHYVDEVFAGEPLMPADPLARARARMIAKLVDEHIHISCMTLTFATANRAHLLRMSAQEMEAELAKAPDARRSEIKRQVVQQGLDAPLVIEALRHQQKLQSEIADAMKRGPYLAGTSYSLADAAARPTFGVSSSSSSPRYGSTCPASPPGMPAFGRGRRSRRRSRLGSARPSSSAMRTNQIRG
jgi:glutathione S-transferase